MLKQIIVPIVCVLIVASSFGCMTIDDDDHPDHATISITSPRISYYDPDVDSSFNAEVTILKITPRGSKIRWDDLYLNISDYNGNKFLTGIPIDSQAPTDDTEFHAIYTDYGPNMDRMDPNDTILFVGMDDRFAGSIWSLIWAKGLHQPIGQIRIPFWHVTMSFISIEERIEDETTWYDLHFQLDRVFSPGTTLTWQYCQIRPGNNLGLSDYISIKPYPIVFNGSVEAWYNDTNGANTTVDDGDIITLSGLSIAYQDGRMVFYHRNYSSGSVSFPSQFK